MKRVIFSISKTINLLHEQIKATCKPIQKVACISLDTKKALAYKLGPHLLFPKQPLLLLKQGRRPASAVCPFATGPPPPHLLERTLILGGQFWRE